MAHEIKWSKQSNASVVVTIYSQLKLSPSSPLPNLRLHIFHQERDFHPFLDSRSYSVPSSIIDIVIKLSKHSR